MAVAVLAAARVEARAVEEAPAVMATEEAV